MAFGQTKSIKGQADMKHPSGYKITIADKSDTGSMMDTERPVSPMSPYFQIGPVGSPFKSPTTTRK